MKILILYLFYLACSSQCTPVSKPNVTDVVKVHRFDVNLATGLRSIATDLYNNLTDAVKQATESIESFTKGVERQFAEFMDGIETRLENFRDAVEEYIESFYSTVSDVGETVTDCIDVNKETAEDLYQQTLESVTQCGTLRVEAISESINALVALTENSSAVIQEVLTEVDLCYNTTGDNVIGLAQCLAAVVVDAEFKATGFLAQTGYQVWQINLSLAALPAALEVCAGKGLIDAGIDTGTVFSEIASCIASSAYESLSPNVTVDYEKINSLLRIPKT